MTPEQLQDGARLLAAATPDTWQTGFAGQANDPNAANLVSFNGEDIVGVAHVFSERNLAAIAWLRTHAAELIADSARLVLAERVVEAAKDLREAGTLQAVGDAEDDFDTAIAAYAASASGTEGACS